MSMFGGKLGKLAGGAVGELAGDLANEMGLPEELGKSIAEKVEEEGEKLGEKAGEKAAKKAGELAEKAIEKGKEKAKSEIYKIKEEVEHGGNEDNEAKSCTKCGKQLHHRLGCGTKCLACVSICCCMCAMFTDPCLSTNH